MIALEGSLRTGSYTDRNHSDVTHYTTDVYVENVEFCGDKGGSGNNTTQTANAAQNVVQAAQSAGVQAEMNYGTLSDFEEILSDRDVPF